MNFLTVSGILPLTTQLQPTPMKTKTIIQITPADEQGSNQYSEVAIDKDFPWLGTFQNQTPRDARWKTSIHEAGHLAAAEALSEGPFSSWAIVKNDGETWAAAGLASGLPGDDENVQIVLIAGNVAEYLLANVPAPVDLEDLLDPEIQAQRSKRVAEIEGGEWLCDEVRIIRWAYSQPGKAPEMLIAGVRAKAMELVEGRRTEIFQIANTLFATGFYSLTTKEE